ncbi:MAG TPA: response regulator [Gammaproteobacteria bacterium]|nr:response regulator [Gammaproteobacteria bacterium]
MALWNLSGKRILIVDDFPDMRSLMRGMVTAFGAQQVEQARNGEEAIELLTRGRFDIVLCDYNLGEGKDGQQVLEEAKHRELLPFTTAFVMVTAENTTQMVMGALEHQPDAYLSKPVTKSVLQVRLQKLLEKKDVFRAINRSLDKGQPGKALALIDEQLALNSRYRFDLLKMKSDLLLRLGDYDEAETLCNAVLEERELSWVLFDLGRIHFHREQFTEACQRFSGLIDQNQAFVAAYDWLARVQERMGNLGEAQQTLLKAVERSGKSLLRQRALGEISQRNQDYAVAESARRKAVRIGKTSALRQASDYTELAKVLVGNDSAKEALKVADAIKHVFPNDPQAALGATVVESHIQKAMGNEKRSQELLEQALQTCNREETTVTTEIGLDLARLCLQHGDKEMANTLACQVVKNHHEDQQVLEQLTRLYREAGAEEEGKELVEKTSGEIVRINNQGVKLLKEGKTGEAVELFQQAVRGMPRNPIVNLNTAQSLITLMGETEATRPRLEAALACLQAARDSTQYTELRNRLLAKCQGLAASLQ